jgi:hypothetical protein
MLATHAVNLHANFCHVNPPIIIIAAKRHALLRFMVFMCDFIEILQEEYLIFSGI